MKKKILFVITDLRGGGAEKVLVNLVNDIDFSKYEVTLLSIFKEGVNRKYLRPEIIQKWIFEKPFKGYSRLALLFSPKKLFKLFIKLKYDVIISFLEGFPSRIVSGCPDQQTKLISWIHLELYPNTIGYEFRNSKEAIKAYSKFNKIICVAESVKQHFINCTHFSDDKLKVLYNPLDINEIITKSETNPYMDKDKFILVSVGRLNPQKGYDRLFPIIKKLAEEDYKFELHILGIGPMESKLKEYIKDNKLEKFIYMHGFQSNPYPYIKYANLFVCSSRKEGYSTVVTESVILKTPVITTNCSGMDEILDYGKAGIIVNNSDEDLYNGIKSIFDKPSTLKELINKTAERSKYLIDRINMNLTQRFINNL